MTTKPAMGTRRFEPDNCANCFVPLPDDSKHRPWLYCSLLCRETASTIRYWRKTSRNGIFDTDPLVRVAIATRLAHMLAGGYNSSARRIPPATRVLVIERDRACVKCGAQGEEIDHIAGDSCDPGNLQLLCGVCHRAKTQSHMVPATEDEAAMIFGLLIGRVIPDDPAQLCDDEAAWQNMERGLRSARLARLRASASQRLEQENATVAATRAKGGAETGPDDPVDDDGDDERGDDYYAGFGENNHYTGATRWGD
jgi:5-methylcytosine-specific restriction endonuclease McrA